MLTATLSKSLGAQGGVVLAAAAVVDHLVDAARPFIFDTGLAPAAAGAALAALDVLAKEPWLADAARDRAHDLARIAATAGLRRSSPDAAVVSIRVGPARSAVDAAAVCAAHGLRVGCFRPPSVPDGVSRVRLTARADLTTADLDQVATALGAVAELLDRTMRTISAPRVLLDGALRGPAAVVIDDGVIVDVLDRVPPDGPDHLRLDRLALLSPGLVDLQVNGWPGRRPRRSPARRRLGGRRHVAPATGVTSYLATFITAPLPVPRRRPRPGCHGTSPRSRSLGGARLLGVHLEGPWIAAEQAGAHDPRLMTRPHPGGRTGAARRRPRPAGLGDGHPRARADGRTGAVADLVAHGVVVSIGHSDATAEQTQAAADSGARMVTHLFNAQRGCTTASPGSRPRAGRRPADPRADR